MLTKIAFPLFLTTILISCEPKAEKSELEPVAQVFDKVLYETDLIEIFGNKARSGGTARNAYIEKWIREALIITEAEKKISKDINIEKLVQDYRNNLLKLEYERMVMEEKMDDQISNEDLLATYQKDKMIYALKEPIIKCSFLEVPKSSPHIVKVRSLWRANNWGMLQNFARSNRINSLFAQQQWIKFGDLKTKLPTEVLLSRKLKKDLKFEATHGENEYFLKIWDIIDKNAEPPLEYISDQLSKVILHRRRKVILNNMTEELYEKEIRRNNIKVFTKAKK